MAKDVDQALRDVVQQHGGMSEDKAATTFKSLAATSVTCAMSTEQLLLRANLSLVRGDRSLGGPARMALLEKIHELGSIRQAALSMGMSYRVAWQSIDALNQLADMPVVTSAVGGKGGGGAVVSEHGRKLIQVFRLLEAEHAHFVEHVNQRIQALMSA